jgi:hypothetical protein
VRNRTEQAALQTYYRLMKTLSFTFALLLTVSAASIAQVHFNSGSARPNDPQAATQTVPNKAKIKRQRPSVRCHDGSLSYSRQNVCTGHGGARKG